MVFDVVEFEAVELDAVVLGVVELDGLLSDSVESDAMGSYVVEFDEVQLDAVEPVVVRQALVDRYALTCCMLRVGTPCATRGKFGGLLAYLKMPTASGRWPS